MALSKHISVPYRAVFITWSYNIISVTKSSCAQWHCVKCYYANNPEAALGQSTALISAANMYSMSKL